MTTATVVIRGDFLDDAREESQSTLDLMMPGSVVKVEVDEPLIECEKCHREQSDVGHEECLRGGEHEFPTPPLTWVDRVNVVPNAGEDEVRINVRPKGVGEGLVQVRLRPDPESGLIRLIVDTTDLLRLRQVDAEEPNGRRTDFLIG